MRIRVVYGSSFGDTADAAGRIAATLEEHVGRPVPCHDVAAVDLGRLESVGLLVVGTSTWHSGDLQDDWAVALDGVTARDWTGTNVAPFGLGDQRGYADTFIDALADLARAFEGAGARLVGAWPSAGYEHASSRAERDGMFVGLALDVEHQPDLSQERIERWCCAVLAEVEPLAPVSAPRPGPRAPRGP